MLFVVILPNDALNSFSLLYKISTVDEMTEEYVELLPNLKKDLNFIIVSMILLSYLLYRLIGFIDIFISNKERIVSSLSLVVFEL